MTIKAIANHIIATEGDFGDQVTKGGIVIKSTAGKSEGIVPRWFKVVAVGPQIDFLEAGEWVLVANGRWTESFQLDQADTNADKYWRLDPEGCLLTADEKPDTLNIADESDFVFAQKKSLY